jgi:hypothetical protein
MLGEGGINQWVDFSDAIGSRLVWLVVAETVLKHMNAPPLGCFLGEKVEVFCAKAKYPSLRGALCYNYVIKRESGIYFESRSTDCQD